MNRLAIPYEPFKIFDSDGNVERLRRYVDLVTKKGLSGAAVIIGSYGFGKTHLLKYLEYLYRSSSNVLPIYIASPGKTFMDFYETVIEKLLLSNANFKETLLKAAKSLGLLYSNETFKKEYYYLELWLLGGKLELSIRRKLGLLRNLSELDALKILSRSIVLCKRTLLILLDEFETILELDKFKRLSYMNALRRLIDETSKNLFLLVASTPAGWEEVVTTNIALSRRLSAMTIYLRSLSKEEMTEFLSLYFPEIEKLFPREVLNKIHEYTNGNPGEVLRLSSMIYDEVYLKEGVVLTEHAEKLISSYV